MISSEKKFFSCSSFWLHFHFVIHQFSSTEMSLHAALKDQFKQRFSGINSKKRRHCLLNFSGRLPLRFSRMFFPLFTFADNPGRRLNKRRNCSFISRDSFSIFTPSFFVALSLKMRFFNYHRVTLGLSALVSQFTHHFFLRVSSNSDS